MKGTKYNDTNSAFRRWCRDNPFNTDCTKRRRFKKESLYLELSYHEGLKDTLLVTATFRIYDARTATFELPRSAKEDLVSAFKNEIEEYIAAHNAQFYP